MPVQSADADPDKDGLSNKIEKELGTDPKMADTDGDGLSDGAEVNQYKTDPAKADTDGDGLSDGDEINKDKTDPVKSDTDGGGVADGAEVKLGTNPLVSKDDIAKPKTTIILEKGKKVILRGVNFETNKATLTRDSRDILENAYAALVLPIPMCRWKFLVIRIVWAAMHIIRHSRCAERRQ